MHMAPALHHLLGYQYVRGAYYGSGGTQRKSVDLGRGVSFACDIDLFDAERDRFPYGDGEWAVVLACELIEHLLHDPVHMLREIHRVLDEDGTLILTTPNVVSWTSVASVLQARRNPQIFSCYPRQGDGERPHVREYTPWEMRQILTQCGFSVQYLFTERNPEFAEGSWVQALLAENGLPIDLRGEQMYCVARKRPVVDGERYPEFLYA
jgi:SAM-dependent methyltransferase